MAWLLLFAAVVLLALGLKLRRSTGIPWVRVRSSDTSGWQRADAPLVSRRFGLVGKPDYIIEMRSGLVPVEVKPGRTATKPYESDLMQLAAYCLLIEDTTGNAPRYGLLRYASETFRLPYTDALRTDVIALLDEIRQDRLAQDVARSHHQGARCRGCGLNAVCDERLV